MPADALFDLDPAQIHIDELTNLSAQQRLTFRQSAAIANGQHPLSLRFGHMPLHDEADPHPDVEGRKCGNCVFRRHWGAHGYPKCMFGGGARLTHGAATDCRAWWPGCRDHRYESEATNG